MAKAKTSNKKPAITSNHDSGVSHWWILILVALAQFMVVLDVSIVNVALPAIQKQFHMTPTSLQWIVTAYTLAFGGFLLLGGRAADLYGRRRVFLWGIVAFTIASLINGMTQSGDALIIFRGIQGLAAAFMSPAALSIILVNYNEGHERNVALSVWGAVAAGGAAVGVLLGGILTQYLSWRWNFFVNVPVGIAIIFAALKILPKHESEAEHTSLDLPGAVLATSGLMALVYAFVKAPALGWTDPATLAYFAVSLLALAGFIFNESRVKYPLMPLGIFRIRNLSGANLLQLFMAAGMFSVFFFTTLYLQEILGYTPVKTGFSFLIIPITIGIVATNVPRLIQKIGYRPILMIAPLFVSSGLFYLSKIPVDGTFWGNVAPGMILMAIGMGATFVSVTIAATSGVPKDEAGLASGILNTSGQVGGAIGLAILTGIATSATAAYFKSHAYMLSGSVKGPGASATAAQAKQLLAEATVHGFQRGYLIASSFGILASLTAVFVIRQKRGEKVDMSPGAGV